MPLKNKKKRDLYHAKWRKENPDKVRASKKKHYKANQTNCIAASRRWEKRNLKRVRAVQQAWRKRNKEKIRIRMRLWKHGISQKEHDDLLKKQKNRCGICRKRFRETPDIDHSHRTGTIRGLLCSACNLGLGHFKDSVRFLILAIQYLKDS